MIILIQFIDITKSKEKEKEAIPTQLPVKSWEERIKINFVELFIDIINV